MRTMLHHLAEPWTWQPATKPYYFCSNAACDVVYFSEAGERLSRAALRTKVGIKEQGGEALLCYCFGVSRGDYERDLSIRDFVVTQTKAGLCSCEISNPSGRCCLKDFPRV